MTEAELIEGIVLRVGMKSLMNHGAASCVYSEGCSGVTQEHLLAFTREVALHCVAALATPATSSSQDAAYDECGCGYGCPPGCGCRHSGESESSDQDSIDGPRYRLLRRGQRWSVIDGIGDTLRAEALDAAVDAASTHKASQDAPRAVPASDEIAPAFDDESDRSENWLSSKGEQLYRRSVRYVGVGQVVGTFEPVATPTQAGYVTAFYELATLMGVPAQPASPEKVWQEQMLPKLRAALAASAPGAPDLAQPQPGTGSGS